MENKNTFSEALPSPRRERLEEVAHYIRKEYPQAEERVIMGPQTSFSQFQLGEHSVGLGCEKHGISLQFSCREAPRVLAERNPKLKAKADCVSIRDQANVPIDDIQWAIDICLKGE